LLQPLLAAEGVDAESFALVRRHAYWLRDWLAHNTHWRLHIDSEVVRLRKSPAEASDPTHPAMDRRTKTPFNRRRYAMFCLALAVLERAERQTVLGQIAREILEFAAADPSLAKAGLVFDLTQRDQRRDLVQVVRLLLDLHVLVRIDGDEEHFVVDRGDVLYSIQRAALANLLCVSRGPSTVDTEHHSDRIHAILDEAMPDTDEVRNRRLRSVLTTRLLDDPILYYSDLTEPERTYLNSQRSRILSEIEMVTGLIPEVRAEGIAMVDPAGELTDLDMLEEGTDGHLALLLAEWLANLARNASAERRLIVGIEAVRHQTAVLISHHHKHWRKGVCEPGAEIFLAEQTLDRLEALRLIRLSSEGVIPLPAIARYALGELQITGNDVNQSNLWEGTT